MAAGFKKAEAPGATLVPTTQTDFPGYVNLARLGITTLAEAQSVRVYADSGKTTEWAREIVSVTEMHFKIPSMSATTIPFVDWDGVRSDYAIDATYGAENVWTNNYVAVWHLEKDPTGTSPQMKDSTANANHGTTVGTFISSDSIVGTIGKGLKFDGSNAVNIPDSPTIHPSPNITVSSYLSFASVASNTRAISDWHQSAYADRWIFYLNGGSIGFYIAGSQAGITVPTLNRIYRFDGTYNKTDNKLSWYIDGALDEEVARDLTMRSDTNQEIRLGKQEEGGNGLDGTMDETRISSVAREPGWIAIEHNNIDAESTFWGTWTDVSTATTVTNIISIGNIVELNNISSIIGA